MENWNLYLVTEEEMSAGRSTLEVVESAIAGGVDVIQLRDKEGDLSYRYKIGEKIRELTREAGIDFIVNDRVDLALALDADGVHLGQDDLPLSAARKVLGQNKLIGISVANIEEAVKAEEGGADYLGVGAIFTTESKQLKEDRKSVGLKRVKEIKSKIDIPMVAIGGLTKENSNKVISAGADSIAVISALTQAVNIQEKTEQFKAKIKETKREEKEWRKS
ncbi:thiamine phosphate synthase [Sporohalobacter salinus]|uniref:thiamine phosphate synthase n=1 Tax=Sporohalobacter salinus TaxID=1494606 RepID=UPI00195F8C55|nr:thiamine phosphate synthase [Sporohalobacter salinus]MBM7624575.1 thiamine-phosphate pyrophosphorylase [Sporohalobacter salinus]